MGDVPGGRGQRRSPAPGVPELAAGARGPARRPARRRPGRAGAAVDRPRLHHPGRRHRRHRHPRRRHRRRRRPAACSATARWPCGACSRSASRSSGRRPPRGWRSTCAGVAVEELSRGDALLTPGAFRRTDAARRHPGRGPGGAAARRGGRAHRLGDGRRAAAARWTARCVRLRLASPLPLRVGDRLLLRDPGHPPGARRRRPGRRPAGAAPPGRRPAAGRRAGRPAAGTAGAAADLARRRVVRADDFAAMGWPVPAGRDRARAVAAGRRAGRRARRAGCPRVVAALPDGCTRWSPGPPVEVVRRALDLPDAELLPRRRPAAAGAARGAGGRRRGRPARRRCSARWTAIRARLAADPFAAPEAGDLAAAGLGARELAAAVRSGQLVRIADGVYLAPGIEEEARARLAGVAAAVHAQPGAAGVGHQPPGRRPARGVARRPRRHRPAARQHPPPALWPTGSYDQGPIEPPRSGLRGWRARGAVERRGLP